MGKKQRDQRADSRRSPSPASALCCVQRGWRTPPLLGSDCKQRDVACTPPSWSRLVHSAFAMSARGSVRERDAWDDPDHDPWGENEDTDEYEYEHASSEDEQVAPAAATQLTVDEMQQRMAAVGASAQLGDTAAPKSLGYIGRKKKNYKWRNQQKAKQMEVLAAATPAFSQSTTFDMEETPNPTHDVQINQLQHGRKMNNLKTMGNHAAMVARIQDAPAMEHTFEEKDRKIVMCVTNTHPHLKTSARLRRQLRVAPLSFPRPASCSNSSFR